jgi:hypothetical protein
MGTRMITKMNEEFIDNTIANLKIIGMLQKSQKLCIRKGQLTIELDDKMQFLRRWLHNDSRDHILMHVKNTVSNAIKIAGTLMAKKESIITFHQWTLTRIMQEMESAEHGLLNLKTTYVSDAIMIANLDVLIDRLTVNRKEIEKDIDLVEEDSVEEMNANDIIAQKTKKLLV